MEDLTDPSSEDVVAGITAADIQTEVLQQASDWVQEAAQRRGETLTSDSITAAMRRRVAVAASHFAAMRRPQYRDSDGRSPYHADFALVEAELASWSDRGREASNGAVVSPPGVLSGAGDGPDVTQWTSRVTDQE